MKALLGIGAIILIVIKSLLMTKREQPEGCIVYFGSLLLIAFACMTYYAIALAT